MRVRERRAVTEDRRPEGALLTCEGAAADRPAPAAGRIGTVHRKSLGLYDVEQDGRMVRCSLSNKLRKELLYPTADASSLRHRVVRVEEIRMVDPVAIGDRVRFVDGGDGTGMIGEVLPRQSKLSRRAPGSKPLEQVVVANVDQVVAIFAAALPEPKWGLLDRYLATAEAAGLPALVCITKMDLGDEPGLLPVLREYEALGYPVLLTSAAQGRGIAPVADALRGKLSVLVGKSGVGKTSLLNALQPGLGLRVNEVSEATGKGKHTTTHLEMFALAMGGSVVDTPGMREFGLWEIPAGGLAALFREMRPYLGQCRFPHCTHAHEPGCAIREAVAA